MCDSPRDHLRPSRLLREYPAGSGPANFSEPGSAGRVYQTRLAPVQLLAAGANGKLRVPLFSPMGQTKIDGIRLARFRASGSAPRGGCDACPGMRKSFEFECRICATWELTPRFRLKMCRGRFAANYPLRSDRSG